MPVTVPVMIEETVVPMLLPRDASVSRFTIFID